MSDALTSVEGRTLPATGKYQFGRLLVKIPASASPNATHQ